MRRWCHKVEFDFSSELQPDDWLIAVIFEEFLSVRVGKFETRHDMPSLAVPPSPSFDPDRSGPSLLGAKRLVSKLEKNLPGWSAGTHTLEPVRPGAAA
jgi:hypothetical protein